MDWMETLKSTLFTSHTEDPATVGRTSAVLLCLVEQPTGWSVLLTKRTQLVATHKGQVSLLGGVRSPEDPSLLETALREAQEEAGIAPKDVKVLGALPPVDTIGQMRIFPWVAVLPSQYAFQFSQHEVEKAVFLSLEQLITQGIVPMKVSVDGHEVQSEGIYCEEELVWGATAKILKNFRSLVSELWPETKK